MKIPRTVIESIFKPVKRKELDSQRGEIQFILEADKNTSIYNKSSFKPMCKHSMQKIDTLLSLPLFAFYNRINENQIEAPTISMGDEQSKVITEDEFICSLNEGFFLIPYFFNN